MNKLDIAKLVNTLAGTQGTIDSVEIVVGYQSMLVAAVDQAYSDIQLWRENWNFLYRSVSNVFTSVATSYTNTDIAKVHQVLYNNKELHYVPYSKWTTREHGGKQPYEYTVHPATNAIIINDIDANYTVDIEYYKVPDTITLNSSVPIIPTRFHMLIVFKALMTLGYFVSNQAMISDYTPKFNIMMGQMMRAQLPAMEITQRPLA